MMELSAYADKFRRYVRKGSFAAMVGTDQILYRAWSDPSARFGGHVVRKAENCITCEKRRHPRLLAECLAVTGLRHERRSCDERLQYPRKSPVRQPGMPALRPGTARL